MVITMWAIKWQSETLIDGKRDHLLGRDSYIPYEVAGYTKMVFRTRQDARNFITKEYGYIRKRPDLQREPHGWKCPIPVRVKVSVSEIE